MMRRSILIGALAFVSIIGHGTAHAALTGSGTSELTVCVIANPGDPCDSSNSTTPPSSGGGGGGGGGGIIGLLTPFKPTLGQVYLSGTGYPGHVVTLLRDGQKLAVVTAGANGLFSFDVPNITPGTYTYSILSSDTQGGSSVATSVSVDVAPGVGTVVSGVTIPPILSIDKTEVSKNGKITMSGIAAAGSRVTILVIPSTGPSRTALTGSTGAWSYTIDASTLSVGLHNVTANWSLGSTTSPFAPLVPFTVGSRDVVATGTTGCRLPDINCDRKINLIDFSVMAYWYHRPFTSGATKSDLNHDGKVDLKDFSILAYYWTS